MSDSARHAVFGIAEATYGVTPETPAFSPFRHTGNTLALSKGSMLSEEIKQDRQIADFRHGVRQTGGDLSCEVSYGSHDAYLEAVLCGTWAAKAAPYAASTISAAASDNSINDSASGLPVLDVGDKVTIAGFTGEVSNNQAGLVVVSSNASKMVLSGGDALVDDAIGEEVTITTLTQQLKAGTTRRSFSFLRHFTDQATEDEPYHLFTGQELNTLGVTIGVEAIASLAFGVMGRDAAAPSGTAPAGSTFAAESTTEVMDSFSGSIMEGGTAIATITELTINLENGIAPRPTIGSDTTQIAASIGRSNCTGQITSHFEDSSLLKKFYNQTESAINLALSDSAGNRLRFIVPRIKYTGGQPDTQGQGPITPALPFQCLKDSVYGSNLVIERTPAVIA